MAVDRRELTEQRARPEAADLERDPLAGCLDALFRAFLESDDEETARPAGSSSTKIQAPAP